MTNNLLFQSIARKDRELRCEDRKGTFYFAIWGSREDTSIPVEICSVELQDDDIDFLACMLSDPCILNEVNMVELKEPVYPYIIRVVWKQKGVLIRFLDWDEKGTSAASIDISHAQKWKIAQMAKRTVFINHFLIRLNED